MNPLPTNEELARLPGSSLLAEHNRLADLLGKTATRRFPTHADGVRRTAQLAAQIRADLARRAEVARLAQPVAPPVPPPPTIVPATKPNGAGPSLATLGARSAKADDAEHAAGPAIDVGKKARRAAKAAVTTSKAPKAAAPKTPTVRAPSVSSRCRELLATHDNADIFAILQKEFGVGDNKKGYPGWYRADAARRAKA
jgi:hypothetical protein